MQNITTWTLSLSLPAPPPSYPDLRLMLVCADFLQRTKCLTQCLKNLSQLRWLGLRPLVLMNHQTTSLALKGETKHSGLLCVVVPVIHYPFWHPILISVLLLCNQNIHIFILWSAIFFSFKHSIAFTQKCFAPYLDDHTSGQGHIWELFITLQLC